MPHETQAGRLVHRRYRLLDPLGEGGFGRVWRARDEVLDVDVAVKEVWLPEQMSPRERAQRLQRAEREARNAARLRDHPNIVAVHDVVVEDDAPWIVMRLVDGRSLEQHVREYGPLSTAQTTTVASALLGALAAAQEAGVLHRDVKPANVLLASNGTVLLTDFGIAVHDTDGALTATGAFIGSVEYIAPERARGLEGQAAGDLFSLGVTLYQAVEGFSPFRRGTPTGSLAAVLLEEAPPPRHAGPLAPLLAGLLAKDPAERVTIPQALALLPSSPGAGAAATLVWPLVVADAPPGDQRAPIPPAPLLPPARPAGPPSAARSGSGSTRRPSRPAWVLIVAAAAAVLAAGAFVLKDQWASDSPGDSTGSGPSPTASAGTGTSPSGSPTTSAPPINPDVWAAQPGDCVFGLAHGSRGEFSESAIRVSCSSPQAKYTVIRQIPSSVGSDCDPVPGWDDDAGGVVVDDYTRAPVGPREICLMPKK